MSSRITLHSGPAVGFDQPFDMLAACHERVRRSLDLLQRLQAHVLAHGVDAQARDAATDVLRYFDIAGPAHHEDEERHVLPRLRGAGLAELATRLHTEHAAMTAMWARLRVTLQAWARGQETPIDINLLQNYISMYDEHLAAEDGIAFATARDGLNESALSQMGSEMASRRQGPGRAAP